MLIALSSGPLVGRTIREMGMLGAISLMTMRDPVRTDGEKTVSLAYPILMAFSTSDSPSGMKRTPS